MFVDPRVTPHGYTQSARRHWRHRLHSSGPTAAEQHHQTPPSSSSRPSASATQMQLSLSFHHPTPRTPHRLIPQGSKTTRQPAPRVDGARLHRVLQEGAVLVEHEPRRDLRLDRVEEVGEDGQKLPEGGLGPPDLWLGWVGLWKRVDGVWRLIICGRVHGASPVWSDTHVQDTRHHAPRDDASSITNTSREATHTHATAVPPSPSFLPSRSPPPPPPGPAAWPRGPSRRGPPCARCCAPLFFFVVCRRRSPDMTW